MMTVSQAFPRHDPIKPFEAPKFKQTRDSSPFTVLEEIEEKPSPKFAKKLDETQDFYKSTKKLD